MKTCDTMNYPFIKYCKEYRPAEEKRAGCATQMRILRAAADLLPAKPRRKFTWNCWNFDCDGDAYIISKDECPSRDNVPAYVVAADSLDPACMSEMEVCEGWCKWQVRTDWEDGDGDPHGWYVVEEQTKRPTKRDGRPRPGWFPVWIVRKGDWF